MGCGISSDSGTDVLGNNVTQNGRAGLLHPDAANRKGGGEESDLNLEDPELEQAATKIQAAFRGHRTRKKMAEEEQIDIDLNDPEVQEAATKIQASFRGHKVRKEIKGAEGGEGKKEGEGEELDKKTEEEETNKEEEAKTGGGGGGVAEEEVVDIDLSDPDVSKAALKIQAQFRGNFGRRKAKQDAADAASSPQ